MNDEKWGTILDRIQSQFQVIDQGEETIADIPNGKLEFIVFDSPMGRLKLERVTKPKVLDRKSFGGSKYGAASGVEYIYSDSEMTHMFSAFKDADGEWESFNAEGLTN
ncbi:hypothetical protein A3K24_03100 [candidate division Kazan bacterium RIFCSPHIGHO2_01_FULL_44_14]|uniref:Uncharacterized protein n=1 Tax=candidate division Kazan bacterium RIFCSPLOWO2_01_FULL_45_19 TaxID=1798538 RepID=A0A1F4NRB0_UNCK3|nr:MAG: hypothetical protein A3K51_03100 [candidate division Kazan bacterium RIFCSPLOWO2_01_FULL_45_19]OGB78033.1 MAG: hypothetical protein A3K24_03100 [candidate division Kazan bacterium RIFCSPHIGHO2_01_FULL_44_14]